MQMTLKALRTNANLSQDEVADKLGISKYTVQNYESAKTFPDAQMIKKIEKLYHVHYDDINFLP